MREFETIKFEENENGVAILTFNRPDKLNALSIKLIEELHEILDYLEWNFDCRVLIITGAGRAFCAGLDLKEFPALRRGKSEKFKHLQIFNMGDPIKTNYYAQRWIANIIIKMRRIPQPIIAAVNGAATGGGFAIAMACDIRIASENAKFNNAFIKIGVSGCDLGSSYFLPRLIGLSRATEILYTGRFFDANEADRIGFVSKVVPSTTLLKDTINLAEEMLLTKSPLGLRLTKEGINKNMDAPALEVALDYENRNQVITANTKDAPEGVISFFEKRPPKYGLR
ncbi:MAG: enoyl-CoA hydratase/isomerase family protein [Candidatus Helarchaeota archaeon]|nr:enoyl-CoA hydratase/isomerase family protein [Candidatus Helarchaeota archaeon]